jgi:hypothetical protein
LFGGLVGWLVGGWVVVVCFWPSLFVYMYIERL